VNNANQHATICTRIDRNGRLRTETAGRDSGFDVSISTDTRNNSTKVFIDETGRTSGGFGKSGAVLSLDGRQARTLYRVLRRHFAAQGKQID